MVRNFQGQKSGLSFIKVELSYTFVYIYSLSLLFWCALPDPPLGGHHENTKLI